MYKKNYQYRADVKSQWHESRSKRLEKKIAFKNLHILKTINHEPSKYYSSVGGTYCHLIKSDERWWVVNHHRKS